MSVAVLQAETSFRPHQHTNENGDVIVEPTLIEMEPKLVEPIDALKSVGEHNHQNMLHPDQIPIEVAPVMSLQHPPTVNDLIYTAAGGRVDPIDVKVTEENGVRVVTKTYPPKLVTADMIPQDVPVPSPMQGAQPVAMTPGRSPMPQHVPSPLQVAQPMALSPVPITPIPQHASSPYQPLEAYPPHLIDPSLQPQMFPAYQEYVINTQYGPQIIAPPFEYVIPTQYGPQFIPTSFGTPQPQLLRPYVVPLPSQGGYAYTPDLRPYGIPAGPPPPTPMYYPMTPSQQLLPLAPPPPGPGDLRVPSQSRQSVLRQPIKKRGGCC